ncbi:hypothetical protein LTR28_004085 [Elasticomyces elasticus]|nr:hypothetical protein LTR28_004085 [Elasticomyces elasticus]
MISDAQLYSLAIFLGSAAMLMIVLYHFLEINAKDAAPLSEERKADALPAKARGWEGKRLVTFSGARLGRCKDTDGIKLFVESQREVTGLNGCMDWANVVAPFPRSAEY